MDEILHQVSIAAPPERVFDAITTENGCKGWWTPDSKIEATVGSIATVGFYDRAVVFRLRVDELVAGRRVRWHYLGETGDEWSGTEIEWDLAASDGGTMVRFRHGPWPSTAGRFAMVNTTWGVLMHRLRDYVEGKNPGPLFLK